MNLSELHSSGGTPFMVLLDLLFLTNIGLVITAVYKLLLKKSIHPFLLESIRHIATFACAYGAFSTLIGLFFAFDALEQIKEGLPFYIISGGLKVGLITVLYGLIIYLISNLCYIVLKTMKKSVD